MPQTLLAILAMMFFSLYSFQQQRNILHSRLSMVRGESAAQATGIATEWLEEIGTKAFDESTKGDKKVSSPTQLTTSFAFDLDQPDDDIDDFDGAVVDRPLAVGEDTLWFRVETKVTYADETNTDLPVYLSSDVTKFKRAVAKVYSLDVSNPDTVRLTQSYACGSKCAW